MARTTLTRRIKRIGRLPLEKALDGTITYPVLEITPEQRAEYIANLRKQRDERRKKAGK